MSDRELLEKAAKAAGYKGRIGSDHDGCIAFAIHAEGGQFLSYWNPITDDGDALRLAVTLGMTIGRSTHAKNQAFATSDELETEFLNSGRDMAAATRRAIIRAAAAIGESMK